MARKHDKAHLNYIRRLPCIRCADDTATEAAHLRRSDFRIGKPITGIGIKPDDRFVLPLCGKCHRLQHEIGEDDFWKDLDPSLWALALHSVTGDYQAGLRLVETALRFQR